MKRIVFISLVIILSGFAAVAQTKPDVKKTKAQTIEREKFDPARNAAQDLLAAVAKAQKENKRIILDVGGEWCVWCVWMDKFFIKNPDLAKLRDENFVWLKINFSEENENKEFLSKYPQIEGYPHLFVLEKDGTFLHSQGTAELEEGKTYNLQRFTDFLKKWSPVPVKTNAARRPEITVDKALEIANVYIQQNKINVSEKYIISAQLVQDELTEKGIYWKISWKDGRFTKGGLIDLHVYMDKSVKVFYWK